MHQYSSTPHYDGVPFHQEVADCPLYSSCRSSGSTISTRDCTWRDQPVCQSVQEQPLLTRCAALTCGNRIAAYYDETGQLIPVMSVSTNDEWRSYYARTEHTNDDM